MMCTTLALACSVLPDQKPREEHTVRRCNSKGGQGIVVVAVLEHNSGILRPFGHSPGSRMRVAALRSAGLTERKKRGRSLID